MLFVLFRFFRRLSGVTGLGCFELATGAVKIKDLSRAEKIFSDASMRWCGVGRWCGGGGNLVGGCEILDGAKVRLNRDGRGAAGL